MAPLADEAVRPCAAGSICTVMLGNTSYIVLGPCDATSDSAVGGCHVVLAIPTGTVNDARLAMLPFIFLWCAIFWSLRYIPYPIKNPLKRVAVQLLYGVGILFVALAELTVFGARAGMDGSLFRNDTLSLAIFMVGPLLGIGLGINSATALRKKSKSTERNAERSESQLRAKS